MRKTSLIGGALIVLLGSASIAAAQRTTMYDWNELSPPQAEFMGQQGVGRNNASQSTATRQAAAGGMSMVSKPAHEGVPKDPPSDVSLSSTEKSAIFRGAIAQSQSAPPDFHPSTGAIVPQSFELYAFDDRVQSLVPAAQKYDYVKLSGDVVLLVDPGSRMVVAMVEPKDITGSK